MSADVEDPSSTKITLTYDDGRWVARDEDSGTTAEAASRGDALAALDAAIEAENEAIDPDDPFWDAEPVAAGGPSDLSANVDEYLYGSDTADDA